VEFPAIALCEPGHHKFRSCEQNKLSLCDVPLIIAQTRSSSSLSRARARAKASSFAVVALILRTAPVFHPPGVLLSQAWQRCQEITCGGVSTSDPPLFFCILAPSILALEPDVSCLSTRLTVSRYNTPRSVLGRIISFYNPVMSWSCLQHFGARKARCFLLTASSDFAASTFSFSLHRLCRVSRDRSSFC